MMTSVATNFSSLAQLCTPEVTLINYSRVKTILVLDQRFLANELLMLGTIYRVTLLTLQVSTHLEVVFNMWTSVITSCVTDNFYTYCLFLLVLVQGYCQCISVPFSPVPSIHFSSLIIYSLFVSLCLEQIKLS